MIKLKNKKTEDDNQSMSAMTDVVFLLLIFFIVTMSTYAKTTFINASIPADSGSSGASAIKFAIIAIHSPAKKNENSSVFTLNGIAHSREQIKQAMKRFASINKEMKFSIKPSSNSLHGDLVFILSTAHHYGFSNLSIMKTTKQN